MSGPSWLATGTNPVQVVPGTTTPGNWSTCDGAPHSQTQTNAQEVCILAIATKITASGILKWSADVCYSSGTNGKTVRHRVYAIPFGTAPASQLFTGGTTGTSVAFGNVLGTDTTNALRSVWGQLLNADSTGSSASSIEYNGTTLTSATTGAIQLADSGQVPTLTGLLSAGSQFFGARGHVAAQFGPKVAFANGTIVVLALTLVATNGGDVVSYVNADLDLAEEALP